LRRILLAAIALLLAFSACGKLAATPNLAYLEWKSFTDGNFSVELPDWPVSASDDQALYSVSDGTGTVSVKTWPLIPRLTAENVLQWLSQNKSAQILSQDIAAGQAQLEYTLSNGLLTIQLHSLFIYCDAHTYEITLLAGKSQISGCEQVFVRASQSALCGTPAQAPHLDSGALGMIILPQATGSDAFDPAAYQQALFLARCNGVQVSHYYVNWGQIEPAPGVYDWSVFDYIVEANQLEDLELSVVVEVIHTTTRGQLPADLVGLPFDDPRFVERLSAFLATFADRYSGRVKYLWVGNEVNNYFASHRDEIPAYAAAFDQARAAVHQKHPDLPMGIVFAYHDAEQQGTLDIIQTLNRGDMIAFALYLQEGFHFTLDPASVGSYLDEMLALTGDTPMAVVETGWSTAPELDGSEKGQAEYVRQLFAALSSRRERIRFLSWFVLHDSQYEACYNTALTFFPAGTQPDAQSMDAFVSFLCYFGLRKSDGTPKLGWEAWGQEEQEYYQP